MRIRQRPDHHERLIEGCGNPSRSVLAERSPQRYFNTVSATIIRSSATDRRTNFGADDRLHELSHPSATPGRIQFRRMCLFGHIPADSDLRPIIL